MNLQAISFRQLAPMMKIPLATIALSIRWAMLLYGMPVVYAVKKFNIFDNVATSSERNPAGLKEPTWRT